MWMILAILSAVFAALTSILAKVGIEGVSSNLATAINLRRKCAGRATPFWPPR